MEVNTRAGSQDSGSQLLKRRDFERILIPKDYALGPVFAATKQTGPREVTVNDRRYQIGGIHPMRPDVHPPALDIRHARALFALLSFWKRDEGSRAISFSFNELCRKYAHSNGGRYARTIANIVADLLDAYIRVTEVATGVSHEYRLIEAIDIEKRPPKRKDARAAVTAQTEIFFHGCTLSEEFFSVLHRITELQHLILNVFTSIRSPLAQAIYLYIPSRAYHHSESDPFEITLTNLLTQVSFPVPMQKNRRRQLFVQNKNPIIKQLDGIETLKGIFRIRLAETADGTDWKFQTWVERYSDQLKYSPKNSKLMTQFLEAGNSQFELDRRLENIGPLEEYDIELLEKCEINITKDRRFLELAKALLGRSRFQGIVAECKADAIEGRKAIKSPMARLIWRVTEAVKEKPNAASAKGTMLQAGSELRGLYAK